MALRLLQQVALGLSVVSPLQRLDLLGLIGLWDLKFQLGLMGLMRLSIIRAK